MCDYSLEHLRSRPAAVADRLVVTEFARTITRGFAAEDDKQTAVWPAAGHGNRLRCRAAIQPRRDALAG